MDVPRALWLRMRVLGARPVPSLVLLRTCRIHCAKPFVRRHSAYPSTNITFQTD